MIPLLCECGARDQCTCCNRRHQKSLQEKSPFEHLGELEVDGAASVAQWPEKKAGEWPTSFVNDRLASSEWSWFPLPASAVHGCFCDRRRSRSRGRCRAREPSAPS